MIEAVQMVQNQGFSILIQNKNFTAKLAKGAKKNKRP